MSRFPLLKRSIVSTGFLLAALSFASVMWLGPQEADAQSRDALAAETAPAKHHSLLIKDFKYQPASLTVKRGDTLEWKNEDVVAHTVTAVDKSFDSGSIPAGGSWKYVAKKPGTFNYICTFHPNMKANLIVQ